MNRKSTFGSLRIICRAVLLSFLLLGGAASAQQTSTYTNPVIAGDYPDPSVIRVGRDYYATTTTGTWSPFFPILHSRDLVNWSVVSYVFDKPPAWTLRDFWAPEIVADGGRYFVYYTARRNDGAGKKGTLCVAVATARQPAGPYTDRGALVCQNIGSIDPFLTRDERNRLHLIWKEDGNDRNQPTLIWAQRLTPDGTRLVGKPTEILRNDAGWERHVVEGSYIIRRNGWFYHFYSGNACCGRECNYALGVARSRKLLGAWEKHPKNPILPANATWQCPGHGSIVSTPDGRDFMLYHAYRRRPDAFSIGREALLDEIEWGADGWPTINDGKGPSTVAPIILASTAKKRDETFFDDFTRPPLDKAWAWPMDNQQTARIETPGGGQLVLATTAKNVGANDVTGGVLARRTTSGDYVATTLVSLRAASPDAYAGLSAYSWRGGAVGVAVGGDGRVVVWHRYEGKHRTTATASVAANTSAVYLRMTAIGGDVYRFAMSTDGREWKELGEAVPGAHVEGARIALTVGGRSGATARFDWIRVEPVQTPASLQTGEEHDAGRNNDD